MALEESFTIIDEALSLAVADLVKRGLPEDEAYIAMLLRLRNIVSPEILQVVDLLSEDEEVNSAINPVEQSERFTSAKI